MELQEVVYDLQSLRQLYRLLLNSCCGFQNSSILDERARDLLKNLLDDAAAKVFEAHLKIWSETQSGVSNKPCSSQPEQPPEVAKSPVSQMNKYPPNKFISPELATPVSQLTKLGSFSEEPEIRKRRCRFCTQNSIKNKISDEKAIIDQPPQDSSSLFHKVDELTKESIEDNGPDWMRSNEKAKRNIITPEFRRNPSMSYSFARSSSSLGTGVFPANVGCNNLNINIQNERMPQKTTSDFSQDIYNAIKRIEAHILAVQLSSTSIGGTSNKPISVGDQINLKEKIPVPKPQTVGNSRLGGSITGQRVKAILNGVDQSLSRTTSRMSHSPEFVKGLVVPSFQDDISSRPSKTPAPAQLTYKMGSNDSARKARRPMRQSLSRHSSGSTASVGPRQKPIHALSTVMRPTQLDQPYRDWENKTVKDTGRRKPAQSHDTRNIKHVAEISSSTTSGSFSSWTTEQSGASGRDSDSDSYLPRHQKDLTSRRFVHVDSESNSNKTSVSSTSHGYYRNDSHSRTYRSDPRKVSENAIGRFKRFKNKLGLIFHHHHHHHHHHHANNSDHNHPMWSQVGKLFRNRNAREIDKKRTVVNKQRKSVVNSVPRKGQVGQFQALTEGMLRHVGKSRKSKPFNGQKRDIGRVRRGQKQKLHWWRMLRRRRHGVKLPIKGRVKLGRVNKRP